MPKEMQNKRQQLLLFIWKMLGLVYGVACTYLYYMQSLQPLDYNNRFFQSDLPYHISMVVDDGWYYSFTAYVYELLYDLPGKTIWIAVFLGCVTYGSLLLTENVLARMMHASVNTPGVVGLALLLQFVMPFYVHSFGAYRYVSYQAGNLWHNSTYTCMKAMSLLCVWLFLEDVQKYKTGLSAMEWTTFAAALLLCTGVKPSFLTVFAPVMAGKLLWDLFRRVPFGKIFVFGTAVLPACLVMLWQNNVLFGADTGNGMEFRPFYTFSLHADKPKGAMLCSILFPVVTAIGTLLLYALVSFLAKEKAVLWKKAFAPILENYVFFGMMAFVGFLLALLLAETGTRERDGNFLWGYCIGIFFLQLVSVLLLRIQQKNLKIFVTLGGILPSIYRGILAAESLVLFYQIYCGIYFFIRLLGGETYFMQR